MILLKRTADSADKRLGAAVGIDFMSSYPYGRTNLLGRMLRRYLKFFKILFIGL